MRDAGPVIGGIFLLGIASNHFGTLISVLGWASNLKDMIFAFRYRSAYEDIKRRERELDEREAQFREQERQRAYSEQDRQSGRKANWQRDANSFRKKKTNTSQETKQDKAKSHTQSRSQKENSRSQRHTPPQYDDTRSKHLRSLRLKPGQDYSADQIRKAYRRLVMKAHPDAGGSQSDFIAVQAAYEWLRQNKL